MSACSNSEYYFGRPATNKCEALAIISDLVTHIRALTGEPRRLVYLYFDGAPEFFTEQVLQKLQDSNIGYNKCCTGHHYQAGGAERAHQSYQATMRTLQDHAGTPSILWPYLYMLVLQLHNLKYIRQKQLVPYTALTGLKPNVTHIHIWGCLSFIHNITALSLPTNSNLVEKQLYTLGLVLLNIVIVLNSWIPRGQDRVLQLLHYCSVHVSCQGIVSGASCCLQSHWSPWFQNHGWMFAAVSSCF